MLLTAIIMQSFCACSDNDNALPAYTTCLVEANANANSIISSIRTDDGTIYSIDNVISANKADTTYRCLATYVPTATGIQVYSLKAIYSAHPLPASKFRSLPHDPVKFISAWRTDRYINLRISLLTTGLGNHAFAFCADSIGTSATNKQTAYISLLHQRPPEDAESYSEEQFLSIPRAGYQSCDSFAITIHTYDGDITIEK